MAFETETKSVAPSWLESCFSRDAHLFESSYPARQYFRLWRWISQLDRDASFKMNLALFHRNEFTTSMLDMGLACVAAQSTRRFALYVCETQAQADECVHAIAERLEEMGVPCTVERYGNSAGWKRKQLRTEGGFCLAGIGMKAASRGVRMGAYRPDLIVLDGIDGADDTQVDMQKKIQTLTQCIVPATAPNCAVVFISSRPGPA